MSLLKSNIGTDCVLTIYQYESNSYFFAALLIGIPELNFKINFIQPIILNFYLCKAFQHSRCHLQTITPKVNKNITSDVFKNTNNNKG